MASATEGPFTSSQRDSAGQADSAVAGSRSEQRYLWQTWNRGGTWTRPEGRVLAALRRGVGRPPGSTPAMWPYYRHLTADGHTTRWLHAEHIALTLIGVHQQSKTTAMHADGVGVGTAVLALARRDDVSEQAVERRFAAAATSTSLGEVAAHLRGLVTQLRGAGIALDYTQLVRDLADWSDPARQDRVRRRWGSAYYAARATVPTGADTSASPGRPIGKDMNITDTTIADTDH